MEEYIPEMARMLKIAVVAFGSNNNSTTDADAAAGATAAGVGSTAAAAARSAPSAAAGGAALELWRRAAWAWERDFAEFRPVRGLSILTEISEWMSSCGICLWDD